MIDRLEIRHRLSIHRSVLTRNWIGRIINCCVAVKAELVEDDGTIG